MGAVSLLGEGKERVDHRPPAGLLVQPGRHIVAPGGDSRRITAVRDLDVQGDSIVVAQAELADLGKEKGHSVVGADRRMPE